ncbi:MAG: amino acid adenylation domain-containing protein [Vulcanimicrobiota bacterium]
MSELAITGLALRFPGANSCRQFWDLLRHGREGISRFAPRPDQPDYVPARGVLGGLEHFERQLFGLSASETRIADPQHLVLLECVWEALANGGYHPARFAGKIGIFAGAASNGHRSEPGTDALGSLSRALVNEVDFLTTRASYHFGLTGPSVVVQSACATSLVALHLAAQSLRNRECDLALVGAVSIRLPQTVGYHYVEGGILSPDGHCRPFDRQAAGTVSSNGAAVLVLRRLEEAWRERDTIRAILKATAVNHDGSNKIGYTAPNPTAQVEVMRSALEAAGVEPAQVAMLEAHGTATRLGDSVEAWALGQVYQSGTHWLGSVKSNLGHLNTAAGMAGLVKAVLSLEHGLVPPTLHFEQAHPELGLDPAVFTVPTSCQSWPEGPRMAAVSSIGLGGTNAHTVLAQAPERKALEALERPRLYVLSARTRPALEALQEAITSTGPDVSFTLRNGRAELDWRTFSLDTSQWSSRRRLESPRLAFVYPGVGDHYPGMGRELYQREAVFRDSLEASQACLGGGLLERLYRGQPLTGVWAHLAVVAIEVALTSLLASWGLRPEATLGHSLGEYVSAYTAGVLSQAQLLRLVRARAEAVEKLEPSAQLVVPLGAAQLSLGPGLHACLENGPHLTVAAGSCQAVVELQERLKAEGVPSQTVLDGRAYHCPLVEPARATLEAVLAELEFNPGQVPWLSNLDGQWKDRAGPDHWLEHLVRPARFSQALARLAAEPDWVVLEVGPGTSLQSLARQAGLPRVASCLGTALETARDDHRRTLAAVAEAWTWGVDCDLAGLDPDGGRVPLAPYPFGLKDETGQLPSTAPMDALEQVWCGVLGLERVGDEDDFFRLGGNSLLALQLIHRLQVDFGLGLKLQQFLQNPTLAAQRALRLEQVDSHRQLIVGEPDQIHQPFELTDVQEAYWVGRRSEFGAEVSTHGYAEIDSSIEVSVMERAWNRLIAHHPMLRAVASADGRQRVLKSVPPFVIDLQPAGRGAEVRRTLESRVVDLQQWPWFKVVAVALDSGLRRYCISFDLLFGDASSWQMFFAQLHQLCHQPEAPLPACGLTFRDYVLAERRQREGQSYQASLAYWRGRLDSLPAAPQLPLVEGADTSRFRRRSGRLEADLWQALKGRASKLGLTPSGVLLSAFSQVLAHWSRSRHFTLNLTLFHRQPLHPDVDRIFGDFTSLALLEVDLSPEQSFTASCLRLQRQLWQDLEHRQVTGVRVLRELRQRLGLKPGPLMPVVFTSTLGLGPEGSDSSVPGQLARLGEMVYAQSQTPQVWLDHQVFERGQSLHFNWDFPDELFPDGVLDDLFEAYQDLLQRLAEQSELWDCRQLDLTPHDHRMLYQALNDTSRDFRPQQCHQPLWEQYLARPEAVAVVDCIRPWTYAQLWRRAAGLARQLEQRGFAGRQTVAVVVERGGAQVAAVLGVLLAGGSYCGLACDDPRLEECMTSAAIEWLVTTEPELLGKVANCLYWGEVPEAPPVARFGDPEDLAYLIFTSGSTGTPKAVTIRHRSVANRLQDVQERLGVSPTDVGLALAPLHFDLSVFDIFGILGAGGRLVFPDPERGRDPAHWAELLEREGVTLWNSVPAFMEMLLDWIGAGQLATSLRQVILSGDFLSPTLPQRLAACSSARLLSGGGATETTIWDICHSVEGNPSGGPIPYGRPMNNARYYVLDEHRQLRPAGVVGHLYAAGEGMAEGYRGAPELSAHRFPVHPELGRLYCTGDLGLLSKAGYFEIRGRADQRLKIRGVRVEAGEVEAALVASPAVEQVAVVARGEPGLQKLYAFYQGQVAPDQLRDWARARLPASMVPSHFVALPRLPLGPTGKVDRGALPVTEVKSEGAPPAHSQTQRLVKLIGEVLAVEVGPDTNLIKAGATSVDMVRLANRIQDELGVRPPLDLLYEGACAAAIAAGLEPASAVPVALGALRDPDEQERFRDARHWHRQLEDPGHELVRSPSVSRRRSQRRYALTPIASAQLGGWLSCLGLGPDGFEYPSAGGLQPVQTYLYLKKGRFEELAGGTYYYDPVAHRLVGLAPGAEVSRRLYGLHPNRPIFDEAALGLYLVADLRAIEPIYGGHGLEFCLLEAGYMSQLLMERADQSGLGVCPIGNLDFEPLRPLFLLDTEHRLVHSLLGGIPDLSSSTSQGADRLLEQVKTLSPEQVRRLLEER